VGGAPWWITPFAWQQSLLMFFIIVAMGVLGGLTLSAVKRSLGAKDWGVMIEGTAACSIASTPSVLRRPCSFM
jgi:phosphatidate cytidylyltransferase